MKIALAVPTAAHFRPERAATLERLKEKLSSSDPSMPTLYKELGERCHFTTWADDAWRFLEESEADWGLLLQDDVIPSPNFWPALRAMLTSVSKDIEMICLESAHPSTPLLHATGEPWYSVADQLIGVGYVARPALYREFRLWRETRLRAGAWFPGPQCVTEDTLFGIFAMTTRRRIYCPVRTIIDHDVTIPSTNGPAWDAHPNRRPRVRWDNAGIPLATYEDPGFWAMPHAPPHLGRAYHEGSMNLAFRWVEGLTDEDRQRLKADDGARALRTVLGRALLSDVDVLLCCLCGRHAAAVRGLTELQVCPGCVGVAASQLLTKMQVRE